MAAKVDVEKNLSPVPEQVVIPQDARDSYGLSRMGKKPVLKVFYILSNIISSFADNTKAQFWFHATAGIQLHMSDNVGRPTIVSLV